MTSVSPTAAQVLAEARTIERLHDFVQDVVGHDMPIAVADVESVFRGQARHDGLAQAVSLGLAWAAAERALPYGWAGPHLGAEYGDPDEGGMPLGTWYASALGPRNQMVNVQRNDTPAEALRNLARALTEKLASQTGDRT